MTSSVFDFSLPDSVKEVPCHLNWIQEFLPHLEITAKDKADSLSKYLTLLLEEELQTFGSHLDDGGSKKETLAGSNHQTGLGSVGHQLNLASFHCYLRNFDSARKYLEGAKTALTSEKLEHEEDRFAAVKYCLDAVEWAIAMVDISPVDRANAQLGTVATLVQSWGNLQNSDQSKATIKFMKGLLGDILRAEENVILELFEEAARLDPDYYLWQHYAYKNVRKTRRCYKLGKLGFPDETEKSYCEKAYELRPDYLPIVVDYAQLLKDCLWMEPEAVWEEKEDDVQRCDDVFRTAHQLAEKDSSDEGRFWLGKLKLNYGEFLLFGKGKDSNQELGKQLFEELIQAYPECNFVLHKVGKLYHWGAFGTELYKDTKKAEEYYLRSLKYEPTFPCLKDYRKLLFKGGRLQELIDVTHKFLGSCRRDDYIVWLLMDLGCMQFIFSPDTKIKENACRSWIQVLLKYPSHREDACVAFKRPQVIGEGNQGRRSCFVPRHSVIPILERMRDTSVVEEEINTISFLINELQNQEEELQQRRILQLPRDVGRLNIQSSSGKDTTWGQLATRPYQPRKVSQADLDNNWRVGGN